MQGRCSRENCKYLHPPSHLKTQLEINGRNNLIQQKTAAAVLAQQVQMLLPGHSLQPLVRIFSLIHPAWNLLFCLLRYHFFNTSASCITSIIHMLKTCRYHVITVCSEILFSFYLFIFYYKSTWVEWEGWMMRVLKQSEASIIQNVDVVSLQ